VGDGLAQKIVIRTEIAGAFGGLLIPLPKNFIARPTDE